MAALTTFYRSGDRISGVATAAITGGQVLKVSAARADGENIHVAPAGAGDVAFGVAGTDAANGATVPVIREGIVGLKAGAAITAGQAVQVDAAGVVIPLAAGVAIGVAIDDIANGATGPVALSL